jgi:hypothetical protein
MSQPQYHPRGIWQKMPVKVTINPEQESWSTH